MGPQGLDRAGADGGLVVAGWRSRGCRARLVPAAPPPAAAAAKSFSVLSLVAETAKPLQTRLGGKLHGATYCKILLGAIPGKYNTKVLRQK